MPKEDFPKEYLEGLAKNHQEKVIQDLDATGQILMYAGSRLNWVGEYVNDESIHWELNTLKVDSLTLTGTSPEWNQITLEQAQADPRKLRELLKDNKIKQLFNEAKFSDVPILVRGEDDKLKLLDGMNRTVAAIRDGVDEIQAYVGTRIGEPQAQIEAHVIYDLIRAREQGRGNVNDFKAALRFLVHSYSNTRGLLETRFNADWVNSPQIQTIIEEVLNS